MERKVIVEDLQRVVREVLDGQMHPILGVRRICYLGEECALPWEVRLGFIGIDSETCDFPLTDPVRARYEEAYLGRQDKELAEYIEKVRPQLFKDLQRLQALLPQMEQG